MTVYTIVFNGYGRFVPQWVEYIRKQTIKVEMIIVLGIDHGANIKYLKDNKIKYIIKNTDNMGELRNAGKEKVKTNWSLYFSVDDELLPHACEEIINTEADAVSLNFIEIEPDGKSQNECLSPMINTAEELNGWKKCWGGYVALKNNRDINFRTDIEVPNLTYHFEFFEKGLKTVRSKTVCAIHHRWDGSHHYRAVKKGDTYKFVNEIEKIKDKILKEDKIKLLKNRYKFEGKQKVISLYRIDYIDEKIEAREGTEFYINDEKRFYYLLGNNKKNIQYIEIVKE